MRSKGQGRSRRASVARRQMVIAGTLLLLLGSLVIGAYPLSNRPTAISPEVASETDEYCPRTPSPAPPSARLSAAVRSVKVAAAVKGTDRALPGYAGVVSCPDTLELFIFWKGVVPASVTAAVDRLQLKATVIENAPHTAVELRQLLARVLDDVGYWKQQGVHIQDGYVRSDGRGYIVGVLNDQTPWIQELMDARYPGGAVEVTHTQPVVPI